MVQQSHTKLLTVAAQRHLHALGLRQRGRSRLWLGDHGWWLTVVEFQPSSWSKGSYLNVSAMWLWCEKESVSFDYGSRLEGLAQFEDDAQFTPFADYLARRAAEEISRLHSLFPTVNCAAEHLAAAPQRSFWETFNAGVASGLAGNAARARQFFNEVAVTDDSRDWAQAAASLAREYSLVVEDLPIFRRRIEDVIGIVRRHLCLPEVSVYF